MIPYRAIGILGALVVAALVVMPPKYFILLLGVSTAGFGVWWLPSSKVGGAACILGGVLLVAYGIKIFMRESKKADDEARTAEEEAQRKNRLPF